MECQVFEPQNETSSPELTPVWVSSLNHGGDILWSRVMVALCCFGVMGNVLNLLALTRRSLMAQMGHMEKSATAGLVALAVSDLLFCLLFLPSAAVDRGQIYWGEPDFSLYYNTYGTCVLNIFVVSSTWLTVVMAMSRYLAICHPLHARLIVDMKFAKASIICVFVVSVLMNLPRFWHFRTLCVELTADQAGKWPDSPTRWWEYAPGILGRGTTGWRGYCICYFLLAVVVPLVILVFCNVYLVRALHQSARMRNQFTRREDSHSSDTTRIVTLTLSIIVVANIVLVAPCEIFTFIDQIYIWPVSGLSTHTIYSFAVAILNVLQVFNFSFNFVMYIIINAHFRRAMREVLACQPILSGFHNHSEASTRYESITAATHLSTQSGPSAHAHSNGGNLENKTVKVDCHDKSDMECNSSSV